MTEPVQDPAWGVQKMAEGWSDAITEANKRIEELEERIAKVREALYIAGTEDHTMWQVGYRAAAERALAVLDGEGEKTDG